jgi:hemolysin III
MYSWEYGEGNKFVIPAKLQHLSVEELANTITHGVGLFLSVIGFFVLVVMALLHGGPALIASSIVYGVSLVVLYAASTSYHSTSSPELKKKLQIVDHCCIYLLIAGSYTPFGIVILGDALGQSLLVLIWAFAAIGILSKLILRNRFTAISVISYLIMGWLGGLAVQPLLGVLGSTAVALAVAGGLAYTLGVIFFALHRLPHNHAIFHVFVMAGSVLHYLAVVLYVVPKA